MKRITANQYQTSERYYKLPKLLFESERYKGMKLEVKVAYSVLKDRLELSLSHGWIDEEGAVYLIYSNAKLMTLLGCSKSKLLSIKKNLHAYGLIEEVQQSSSEKGRMANKIYLGELEHDAPPVSKLDGGSVSKRLGQSETETGLVSNSTPSETEGSETNISETKGSDYSVEDEEERNHHASKKKENTLSRKVDKATCYDKDYIWHLVYDRLEQDFPKPSIRDGMMLAFEERYAYALANMNYAKDAETIAEYVYNGILATWNKRIRQHYHKE
ncbi:TPA: replication initiator protein A [Streptococcus agalactiae]|nr:replication initiator protein A [Streptococcus agalactiae]